MWHRGKVDHNTALQSFALTLEKVCVDTVESGFMTKDLASLVGENQRWLTTEEFMDKLSENLENALTGGAGKEAKLKAV